MSLAMIFTSCSSITGGPSGNTKELYKAAIERYYNSVIQADTDTFLDSIDPLSSLYPPPDVIETLRTNWEDSAALGEAVVQELTIIEESAARAKVKAKVLLRVDLEQDGEFNEDTIFPTFELTFKDGTWRIFSTKVE